MWHLAINTMWANSADNKLMTFFLFSPEIRIWHFKQIVSIGSGNILSWRLIMKYFLQSFSPFGWFKKGSCQFHWVPQHVFMEKTLFDWIRHLSKAVNNYVPHYRGEHILFSADPVGVDIASCLHSISLLNGWILAKLTQIYHWMGEKCWLDFGDLDPIFKVTQGLRLLENAGKWLVCTLSPEGTNWFWPTLHIYIAGTCKRTDEILVTLTPFSRSRGLRLLENGLSTPYLLNEWMDFY